MKPMLIEKRLELGHPVDELLDCRVLNEIHYQQQEEGIRALGTLQVRGQVREAGQISDLDEEITLDVLAPLSKLQDPDRFRLRLHHYDAQVIDRQIVITVQMNVYGMKEDRTDPAQDQNESAISSAMAPIRNEPEPMPETESLIETDDIPPVSQEEGLQAIEDLFDDDDCVLTTCRYVLARPGDTYAAIAERCHVAEKQLIALNHNKPLQEKTLVLLP